MEILNTNYVCQLKDGMMLMESDTQDGYLEVAHVGYPYPNTPKSNTAMLKDLINNHTGIDLSENFFITNYPKIIIYANNTVYASLDDNFKMTVSDLAKKLLGDKFLPMLLNGKDLYVLFEYNDYRLVLVKDVDIYDIEENYILVLPESYLQKYSHKYNIKTSEAVVDKARSVIRKAIFDHCVVRVMHDSVLDTFLKLAIDCIITDNIVYDIYRMNNLSRFIDSVLNHITVLDNFLSHTVIDILCKYLLDVYDIQIKNSELYDIFEMTEFSVGEAIISYSDVVTRAKLVIYCIKVDLGYEAAKFKHASLILHIMNCMFMRYSSFLKTKISFTPYVCSLDLSDTVTNGHLCEFYNKCDYFRGGVNNAVDMTWMQELSSSNNHISPTLISDNIIEWDLDDVFDEELYSIRDMLYEVIPSKEIRRSPLKDIIDNEMVFALMQDMYQDIKDVDYIVFESEKYNKRRKYVLNSLALTKYRIGGVGKEGSTYFEILPRDVYDMLGEFNLFAKIFCCSENSDYFKAYSNYSHSDKDNTVSYSYTFSVTGDVLNISNSTFEKYVKGACIIDFINRILSHEDLKHNKISLENIKVAFNEDTQIVKLRYSF